MSFEALLISWLKHLNRATSAREIFSLSCTQGPSLVSLALEGNCTRNAAVSHSANGDGKTYTTWNSSTRRQFNFSELLTFLQTNTHPLSFLVSSPNVCQMEKGKNNWGHLLLHSDSDVFGKRVNRSLCVSTFLLASAQRPQQAISLTEWQHQHESNSSGYRSE